MLKRHRGELLLICGAIFFSANGIVSKWVLESGLSAARMTQFRSTFAFLVFFIFLLLRDRASMRAKLSELPTLFAFGIFGFAAVQGFYFYSIARLPVSIALIIEFTAPIWIALWLRFIRKESIASSMWIGLALGLSGLILLAQVWKGLTFDGVGILSSLLDALALATYFLMSGALGGKRSGPAMLMWGLGTTALFFAIIQPWWSYPFSILSRSIELHGRFAGHHLPGWVLLTYVVLLGTVLPYFCVIEGVRATNPSTASVIGMLEPVLAGVFAWIALNERFNLIQLSGAAVVLVGIYIADQASAKRGSIEVK
jgi:drug/metabolite transporter (DMT)-like permease